MRYKNSRLLRFAEARRDIRGTYSIKHLSCAYGCI